jgi:hypothetical protein
MPRPPRPSSGPNAINLLPDADGAGRVKKAKNDPPVCHMSLFFLPGFCLRIKFQKENFFLIRVIRAIRGEKFFSSPGAH